jgi:hypothetical protein
METCIRVMQLVEDDIIVGVGVEVMARWLLGLAAVGRLILVSSN